MINKIADVDKFSILKCSIKGDTIVWLDSFAFPSFRVKSVYEDLVNKLKMHFANGRKEVTFRRDSYGKAMSMYDKSSVFLLRTVDSKIIPALEIIFAIFLWFDCPFLLSHAYYKQYKA